MEYVFMGLMVSVGWHVAKLLYRLVEEILFSRLHAVRWYAMLCKKQSVPAVSMMPKSKKEGDYRGTSMGFRQSI